MERFKLGRKTLGFHSGEEYEEILYQEVYQSNLLAAKILLPCVTAIQIYNISRIFLFSRVGLHSARNAAYFVLYLLMIGISLLTGIFLYYTKGQRKLNNRVWFGYGTFFVFWHLVVNYMDLQRSNSLSVFLLALMVFATVFFVTPWQGLTVILASLTIFLWVVYQINGGIREDNLGDFTNPLIFALMALFICYLHYTGKIKNAENQYLILKQNEEITWMNHQLGQLADTDFLSGLYNRRYLDEVGESRLRYCVREKNGIALMMLDVDDFKQYNDYYGHQKGDEAIKILARVLRRNIPNPGDLAVRYGGEEFTVILYDTTAERAKEIAQAIRQEICREKIEHLVSKTRCSYLTVSIGVYFKIPEQDTKMEEYFQKADKALYRAKREGKNQVCFEASAQIMPQYPHG